jgi:hypothetical protein
MSLVSYRDFTNYGLAKLVGSREKRELEVLQGRVVQIEKDLLVDSPDESANLGDVKEEELP